MPDDVFTSDTDTTQVTPTKTPEDRLQDKDEFIEKLKSETAALRKELEEKLDAEKALEELRNELRSLKEQKSTVQPREQTAPALSAVDIKTLVQQTINETVSSEKAAKNIKEAHEAVVAHFGGDQKKAAEAVQAKAQELGLPMEMMKDVAAKSPGALINVMGLTQTVKEQATFVKGTVNTAALQSTPVVGKVGTYEYFQDIFKKDRARYFSPLVQQQIMKAAKQGTYVIP